MLARCSACFLVAAILITGDGLVEAGKETGKVVTIKLVDSKASQNSALAKTDTEYKGKKHKAFLVQVQKGASYTIDVKSDDFGPKLVVVDSKGKELKLTSESFLANGALVVFDPVAPGQMKLVVTHFGSLGDLKKNEFEMSIVEKKK